MEKWTKRKFHKIEYFLKELSKSHWAEEVYTQLHLRVKRWAGLKPWKTQERQLSEQSHSIGGTSTPFSHYDSFSSLSVGDVEKEDLNERGVVAHRLQPVCVERSGSNSHSKTPPRSSGLTGLKSKSCFSKSLSVLDRANRVFGEAREEESRLSRAGRDVKLGDLMGKGLASEGRDVARS